MLKSHPRHARERRRAVYSTSTSAGGGRARLRVFFPGAVRGAAGGKTASCQEGGAEKRGQEEAGSASCPFLAPRASDPNWELRRVQTLADPWLDGAVSLESQVRSVHLGGTWLKT